MVVLLLGLVAVIAAILVLKWALSGDGGDAEAVMAGGPHGFGFAGGEADEGGPLERLIRPTVGGLGRRLQSLTPIGLIESINRKIVLAGLQGRWSVEQVLVMKAIGFAIGSFFAFMVFVPNPGIKTLIFSGLALYVGGFGADTLLARRADKRRQEMERELPDILDQITIQVEAGLGFEAALARTAAGSDGPLALEIGRAMQDVRLGIPRGDALRAMTERTDVADLRLFIRALRQAEKAGVPIARVLRVQSEETREKRRQRAEERAMKMPVKLIFPLVMCIMPSLFIVLLGPAALRIIGAGGISGSGG